MADAEDSTNRWRDVLTVVLGPSALGGIAGCVVGSYLAITGSIQDPRAGLAAPLTGLAPIGATVGALYALAGIPLAALAIWWIQRTGSRVAARAAATVAGTAAPAGVMIADASSAPLDHASATWAVAVLGTVLIAGTLWALLGRLLPRNDEETNLAGHEGGPPKAPTSGRRVGSGARQ